MKTFTLVNINVLCYCLTVVSPAFDKKSTNKNIIKQPTSDNNVQHELRNHLLSNLGLNVADMQKNEEYTQLSESLPHLVPDFMRSLFDHYRFELFNLSLNIEGHKKHLGPIEMIQSHRLREIHTWHKVGIHKLIFKEITDSDSVQPFVRDLRLNKKLFPRKFFNNPNRDPRIFNILAVFNSRLQTVKRLIVRPSFFSSDGWLSLEISNNKNDSVFYLKFFRIARISNRIDNIVALKINLRLTKELYPYYANIINFYKYKSPLFNGDQQLNHDTDHKYQRHKRYLFHYSLDHNGDCQRYPLVVTFKEVGWSKWIIAPQHYNAFYCKGNCPYPLSDNFNTTNHAIIQLLVHGLKDVSVPKPCCVPYQLTSETLLYLNNEGDALLREFKDMSVISCSCR